MASLYKKPIIVTDPATGKRVKAKSRKWWGRFRDAMGREKRVPLANDKPAAQAMLTQLVRKVEQEAAGLTDPYEEYRMRPLTEHANDFRQYLCDKGNTPEYTKQSHQRITKALKVCSFSRLGDISASKLQSFIGGLRRAGMGITSCNHYLRAFKMFIRWMARDRRSPDNPVAHLSMMNAETERRHVRRPLGAEEFQWLLDCTQNAPPIEHITGEQRVFIYMIACYTGFRRNEISSLTRQSIDLQTDPPTLTVQAAYSKRRRVDVLPLRKDLADIFRKWLDRHPDLRPDEPLLDIRNKGTAYMLRKDLKRARKAWIEAAETPKEQKARSQSAFLSYIDDRGRVVDFHALRKTFITNLCLAGVSPKAAQVLARHCDINLTMNVYTMLSVQEQALAVEALPPIPQRPKTGKDSEGGKDEARRAGYSPF